MRRSSRKRKVPAKLHEGATEEELDKQITIKKKAALSARSFLPENRSRAIPICGCCGEFKISGHSTLCKHTMALCKRCVRRVELFEALESYGLEPSLDHSYLCVDFAACMQYTSEMTASNIARTIYLDLEKSKTLEAGLSNDAGADVDASNDVDVSN